MLHPVLPPPPDPLFLRSGFSAPAASVAAPSARERLDVKDGDVPQHPLPLPAIEDLILAVELVVGRVLPRADAPAPGLESVVAVVEREAALGGGALLSASAPPRSRRPSSPSLYPPLPPA